MSPASSKYILFEVPYCQMVRSLPPFDSSCAALAASDPASAAWSAAREPQRTCSTWQRRWMATPPRRRAVRSFQAPCLSLRGRTGTASHIALWTPGLEGSHMHKGQRWRMRMRMRLPLGRE